MSVLVLSVPNSPSQTGAVPAALMYSQYLFQMASRLAAVVLLVNHGCDRGLARSRGRSRPVGWQRFSVTGIGRDAGQIPALPGAGAVEQSLPSTKISSLGLMARTALPAAWPLLASSALCCWWGSRCRSRWLWCRRSSKSRYTRSWRSGEAHCAGPCRLPLGCREVKVWSCSD